MSEVRASIDAVLYDPWCAIELPLPDTLDLDGLRQTRGSVYAIIQALGGTHDDNLPFIGLPAELERRIALNERTANL
jgi:hypothetical protein